jgi:hypothetical protein
MVASTTGSRRWESTVVAPWPGKCLPTGATPPAVRPRMNATAARPAVAGSAPKERSPMTPSQRAPVTSSTGARSAVTPRAARSRPVARP